MEENKDTDYKLLILPKEKLPECWADEMRMSSLCAPIRAKTVNPLDYGSKMKFWSSMIHLWCNYYTIPSFTLEDLNNVFKWNGVYPLCLPLVIEEMVKMGDLSRQTDFLEPPPSESWAIWSLDIFVKKPLSWTFNKMKDTLFGSPSNGQSDCIFVYIAVVEKQAKKILDSIKEEHKDKILTLDNLKEITGEDKINLALYLLHKKRKVTLQNSPDNKCVFVKFNSQNKSSITPIDLGIFTLKNNEKALIKNIEDLESDKEKLTNEAKTFLAKGSRQLAKSSLRKKKEVERCIEKRAIALENVQTLLSSIRDAETDAMIVDAYEYGLDALRQTFKEAGLNEENVSNTMDNVKEAVAIGNDISHDIAQPISDEGTDAEFEAELEMLMTDVEEITTTVPTDEDGADSLIRRLAKLRMDLPSPPKDIPSSFERKRDTSKIKVQL